MNWVKNLFKNVLNTKQQECLKNLKQEFENEKNSNDGDPKFIKECRDAFRKTANNLKGDQKQQLIDYVETWPEVEGRPFRYTKTGKFIRDVGDSNTKIEGVKFNFNRASVITYLTLTLIEKIRKDKDKTEDDRAVTDAINDKIIYTLGLNRNDFKNTDIEKLFSLALDEDVIQMEAQKILSQSPLYRAFSTELNQIGFRTKAVGNDKEYSEWKDGKSGQAVAEVQLQAICQLYHAQKHYNMYFDITSAELYVAGDGSAKEELICQFDGDSFQTTLNWRPYFVIDAEKVDTQTTDNALVDIASLIELLEAEFKKEDDGGYNNYGLFYAMFSNRFKNLYFGKSDYNVEDEDQYEKIKSGQYHQAPLSIALKSGDARATVRKEAYDQELAQKKAEQVAEAEALQTQQESQAAAAQKKAEAAAQEAAQKTAAAEKAEAEKEAADRAEKEATEKAQREEDEKKRAEAEAKRLKKQKAKTKQKQLRSEQQKKDVDEQARIAKETKENAKKVAAQKAAAAKKAAVEKEKAEKAAAEAAEKAERQRQEAVTAAELANVVVAEENLSEKQGNYPSDFNDADSLKNYNWTLDELQALTQPEWKAVGVAKNIKTVGTGRTKKIVFDEILVTTDSEVKQAAQILDETKDDLAKDLADLQASSSLSASPRDDDLKSKAKALRKTYDKMFTKKDKFRQKNKKPIYSLDDFKAALDKAEIKYEKNATLSDLQFLAMRFFAKYLRHEPKLSVIRARQKELILSMLNLTKTYFGRRKKDFDLAKHSPQKTLDLVRELIPAMGMRGVLTKSSERLGYNNYDDIFTYNKTDQRIFYLDMFKAVVLLQLLKNHLNENIEKTDTLIEKYEDFLEQLKNDSAKKQKENMITFFKDNGIIKDEGKATTKSIIMVDKSISILEEIERNNKYIVKKGGENTFDIDKINTEIISGLTNVYKKHNDVIKKTPYVDNALSRIHMTADFKGLTLSNDIGYHYIGDRDFNGQTKYFHALSIGADILNHIVNGKKVPDLLHERCVSEWPLSFQLKKVELPKKEAII